MAYFGAFFKNFGGFLVKKSGNAARQNQFFDGSHVVGVSRCLIVVNKS
jgi:hypothetical protein